ncbi:MAG: hypothetical protein J6U17_00415 [Kiritimatiellae bacterium]|nr:hypothetical protein [Kiritimatiellia bacterium]
MSLNVSRTTDPLRFDVGIGRAGYADILESPVEGQPQKALLPGSTTVSQAIDELFPTGQDVSGEIMRALVSGNPPELRMPGGFASAARRSVGSLRSRRTQASDRAAHEIENLLADTDLFEHYRLALLET